MCLSDIEEYSCNMPRVFLTAMLYHCQDFQQSATDERLKNSVSCGVADSREEENVGNRGSKESRAALAASAIRGESPLTVLCLAAYFEDQR